MSSENRQSDTMGIDETKIIELERFGGEGYLEMAYPSFRKKDAYKRVATATITKLDDKGKPYIDRSYIFDFNLVMVLSYVESAPFFTEDAKEAVEKFYEYTEKLDKKKRGTGEALYNEMVNVADEIEKGATSPFAVSQEAE